MNTPVGRGGRGKDTFCGRWSRGLFGTPIPYLRRRRASLRELDGKNRTKIIIRRSFVARGGDEKERIFLSLPVSYGREVDKPRDCVHPTPCTVSRGKSSRAVSPFYSFIKRSRCQRKNIDATARKHSEPRGRFTIR